MCPVEREKTQKATGAENDVISASEMLKYEIKTIAN